MRNERGGDVVRDVRYDFVVFLGFWRREIQRVGVDNFYVCSLELYF